MALTWKFETCLVCHGKNSARCPVCKGDGFWEFVADDNHDAVLALIDSTDNERAKEICNRRMQSLTPDNVDSVLFDLSDDEFDGAFEALHDAGAERWGWAWVHTNRFAIELSRLCGASSGYSYALSRLAWNWLEEEKQKKLS